MSPRERHPGERFDRALLSASGLHRGQLRKGGEGRPYVAHLLGVAALVLEDGGDEDEAIAALLHDAAEDQGGEARLAEVGELFGPRVASIVRECSDTTATPKPPWPERKLAYLEHLPRASPSALRVSLADKLYNARMILLDYRRLGEELWVRDYYAKAVVVEGDPARNYYIQFAVDEGGLFCEAVHNKYLEPGDRLTGDQVAKLLALGWQGPDHDEQNLYRVFSPDAELAAIADLVRTAFEEVYGVPREAPLRIEVSWR